MYYPKALKEYTRKFVTDMVCACLLLILPTLFVGALPWCRFLW